MSETQTEATPETQTEAKPAPPTDEQRGRAVLLSAGEIMESASHLLLALLMPAGEARTQKIAGCIAGIERALKRIRMMVLD